MQQTLYLYGAGGFAREVAWLVDSLPASPFSLKGFVSDAEDSHSGWQDPRPVRSLDVVLASDSDCAIAIAVARPAVRTLLAERLAGLKVPSPVLIHDGVRIGPRVVIGAGSIVCAGTTLTTDITLGCQVQLNLHCTIGHDVIMGDYCTLSPGVHVSGNVTLGSGVFIGTGATILQGAPGAPLTIGEGSVVAAGACVTRTVPPNTLVAGVPAVVKKTLN